MPSRQQLEGRACARLLLAILFGAGLLSASPDRAVAAAGDAEGIGPSVKEVVEFTRLVRQEVLDLDSIKTAVSPDRSRAFIVTRRADVARDLNVYQVLLLDLRPEGLRAGRPPAPRTLWSFEVAQDPAFLRPCIQDARWVDGDTIAMRARPDGGAYQVYALDARSGRVTQRTFEPHGVESFAFAANLSRIVYAARVPNPPLGPGERSVVVDNRSFYSVTAGQTHPPAQKRRFQYAVIDAGARGEGRRLGGVVAAIGGATMPVISVAPDGRWALIPRFEAERHLEWAARYPLMGDTAAKFGTALLIDPKGYFTQPHQWLARRQVAYRLADGFERPVADAPDDTTPMTSWRVDRLWQEGGASVIVAGTHLPAEAGSRDAPGTAPYVVEFWPDSGRRVPIASLEARVQALQPDADGRAFTLVLEGGARRRFVRAASGWSEVSAPEPAGNPPDGHPLTAGWRLRVEQAADRPPDLVAEGPAGESVRLTNLHPQFSTDRWGRIRPFDWTDSQGRRHAGGLLLPADHDPSRRYPVVLQTYGFNPKRFYLDGGNLADAATSGYAGRAFLRQGILVLAMPNLSRSSGVDGFGLRHVEGARMARSAIAALVDQGIADPARIGIMGWSVWGEFVLNMITFHDLPVRAASLLDGDSNSLFTQTVTAGASDSIVRRFEATNQGTPFGPGLSHWVARDPSLHTDCIRAAVRMEIYGPVVQGNWDIHALLRRQYKPAELVVIPGGSHSLAQPSERMISLQGNVDWHRFWLKDEVRLAPLLPGETAQGLRERAARWKDMAEMKLRDEAQPRCDGLREVEG